MNNEIKYNGYWWLPQEQNNKICGSLKLDPFKQAKIKLMDDFQKKSLCRLDSSSLSLKDEEIILGKTLDHKNITLYKCTKTSGCLYSTDDIYESSYVIDMIFIGHHFEKKEDIQFDSVSISYSHLDYWLSTFESTSTEKDGKKEISYDWKLPKAISYNVDNFKINFRVETTKTMFDVHQKAFVQIEPNNPMDIKFYLKTSYLLQNFLSFGVGRAVHPLKIVGTNDKAKTINEFTSKPIYFGIEIYYISNWKVDNTSILPKQMLLSYSDISSNFDFYIKNWCGSYIYLEPVYDLYFSVVYRQNMYLQNKFLNLAHALESYHRRVFGGKYLPEIDYEAIKDCLIKSIPARIDSSFRDSLTNKIKYGNEFSLRKRLKMILDKFEEKGLQLNSSYDKNSLISDIVNIRNQLTHYDKDSGDEYKEFDKLVDYCDVMENLIKVCFLLELEISDELLTQKISTDKYISLFLSLKTNST